MNRRTQPRIEQLRHTLAQEAARIMAEHGVVDFLFAKRKAAERLGVSDAAALPKNAEIEAALVAHQRLFRAEQHDEQLRELRRSALRLMQLLVEFQPRLVGAVLSGSATIYSDITLHLFAEQAERVALTLLDRGIDHQHAEKKLRYEAARQLSYPSFKFVAGRHAVEIVVLPLDSIRQAPLSPVDGKPMQRAAITELELLVQ